MWPNCLGVVRKAGIRCPHQLVVGGGGNRDIAGGVGGGAGGVLSTFYLLMSLTHFAIAVQFRTVHNECPSKNRISLNVLF